MNKEIINEFVSIKEMINDLTRRIDNFAFENHKTNANHIAEDEQAATDSDIEMTYTSQDLTDLEIRVAKLEKGVQ